MSSEKFGKYTLIERIATGGMAEIWLAEQRGPGGFNKELVIKRILPHLAGEGDMTQMFIDEARLVAHLTHPNIGQVFELGEHDGDYFIAMEFIDGMDLSELMDRCDQAGEKLPIPYVLRIVRDVLRALDYAHQFSTRSGETYEVIHRDISPQNVLVSNDGIVKLVDFGVAKAELNRHKTETGAVKGKFAYMAPEQIENGPLDRRVDIFALGVVFYELLTGKKPFGDDLKAVSNITSGEAPDPREYRAKLPPLLVDIVMRALQQDREKRFSSAVQMEEAIDEYLELADQRLVGERQLARLVGRLEGRNTAATTEQLFGAEKHGVDRSSPRLTSNGTGSQPGTSESGHAQRERTVTVEVGPGEMDDSAGSSRRLPLVVAGGMVAMLVVAAAGLFVMMSVAEPKPVMPSGVEIEVADDEEASKPGWRHSDDVRVVFIDTEDGEPVAVSYDGQEVGTTPFHTLLQPGEYEVAVGAGTTVITVEDEGPVQRFVVE